MGIVNKKKPMRILFISSTRADYGLQYPLIKRVLNDNDFKFDLIVTGTHLSKQHGLTIQEIKNDKIPVSKIIKYPIQNGNPAEITKAKSIITKNFSSWISKNNPDLIFIYGDRFEMLEFATTALAYGIPCAHISGGEKTEGTMDESIRHAITKLSHLHFVSTEEYKKRVIQLGEQPKNVFNVGAPAVENIKNLNLLSRIELESKYKINLNLKWILVTLHPTTHDTKKNLKTVKETFKALAYLKKYNILLTAPNSDPGFKEIENEIHRFIHTHSKRSKYIPNLGFKNYLSILPHVTVVLGNSSSGIVESPSFKVPAINIGDRQQGRVRAKNIIDCKESANLIIKAVLKANTPNFRAQLKQMKSPFGNGEFSKNTIKVIKKIEPSKLRKKIFYDINYR